MKDARLIVAVLLVVKELKEKWTLESKDKVLEAMDYSDTAAAQRVNRLGLGGYVLLAVVVAMVSMRRAALKQT